MAVLKSIEYPFASEIVHRMNVGDMVSVSGRVFTGRDRLHKFLFDGGKIPVSLENSALFHCGPIIMAKDQGWVVRAAGPTTSIREEPYMADIIEKHKIRLIIGKGGMGEQTRQACLKCGCVYLEVTGGTAALLAARIESVNGVYFLKEFGPAEAMWDFTVKDMVGIVTMDARGRSLHKKIQTTSKRVLKRLGVL